MSGAGRVSAVVKVAATPHQAQLLVAKLRAHDIPAFVDPDGAADEFAMSQRMMNLTNVKVMVPASALERAREVLEPYEVDADELERQALAAGSGESPPTAAATPTQAAAGVMTRSTLEPETRSMSLLLPVSVLATGAAVLFCYLWLDARSREMPAGDNFRWQATSFGFEQRSRFDDRLLAEYHDADEDGVFEKVVLFSLEDRDGRPTWRETLRKPDDFGNYLHRVLERQGDLTVTSHVGDERGLLDHLEVEDASGNVVQIVEWQPDVGYVVKKP